MSDDTRGRFQSSAGPSNAAHRSGMRQPPVESYLRAADLDFLARMNMELLAELWITRDRLAILEAVLIERGVTEVEELDTFSPTETLSKRLEQLREVMVENVLGAPFKNDNTVESLMSQGKKHAQTWRGKQ
ncbi:MAG: hypothetical protein JJU27_06095 [Gammaproteobacteria bacterium]|nr:hypothetical protein [Gammaproteobacteria bacterium]